MGRLFLIICVLSVFIFLINDTVFSAYLPTAPQPQDAPYLIADIQYEILKNYTNVVIGTNKKIEFIYYTLDDPYRIVIDLIGVIFCDLEQNIEIEEGPVKSIAIIEDSSVPRPGGLDKYFYAVDYIVVELRKKLPSQTFSSKDGRVLITRIKTKPAEGFAKEAEPTEVKIEGEELSRAAEKQITEQWPSVVIIEELGYEVNPNSSDIFLVSDKEFKSVVYEEYNPYRIVIIPQDNTFCELKEKMEPMDGMVKSIYISKGQSKKGIKLPGEFFYPVKDITIEPIVQLPYSLILTNEGKLAVIQIKSDIKLTQAEEKESPKQQIMPAPKPEKAKKQPAEPALSEREKIVDEITDKLYKKQEELFAKQEEQEERKRIIREARDKAKAIRSIEKIGLEEVQDLMVKTEGAAGLKYCQDIGLSYSENVAVSEEEAKLAKMKVKENFRTLFPSVKFKGSESTGNSLGVEFTDKSYGVEAEHPLYQGSRLWNAYKQSKVNLDLANARYNKAIHDLNYKVAEAYYSVVTSTMNIKLQRELLKRAEGILKIAQKRRASGLSTDLELFNVTSQYNQVQFQLASAERDVALASFKLQQAMGLDIAQDQTPLPEVETDLKFELIDINLDKCLELSQQYHPDILVNELLVESNEYEEKIARGKDSLKVDLTGFYGRAGSHYVTEPEKLKPAWNFGVKVSKPFWGNTASYGFTKDHNEEKIGLTTRQETKTHSGEFAILDAVGTATGIKEASIKRHKAENDLLEVRRQINLEVKEAYYSYQEAIIQIKNSLEKVRYQKEALKTTTAQAQLNEALQSQVLDAEIKLADERSLYIKALSDYNFSLAKLNKAVGIDDFFNMKKEQADNGQNTADSGGKDEV